MFDIFRESLMAALTLWIFSIIAGIAVGLLIVRIKERKKKS